MGIQKKALGSTLLQTKHPGRNLKTKATVALALLESGFTVREAARAAGVSHTTAARLSVARKRKDYIATPNPLHVAAVKKTLQDRFLLEAAASLDSITPADRKRAGYLEKMKVASIAAERSAMSPYHSPMDHHLFIMKMYDRPVQARDDGASGVDSQEDPQQAGTAEPLPSPDPVPLPNDMT
jgi:hypothetical protein